MLNYIGCVITKNKELCDSEIKLFPVSQETIKYANYHKDSDWSDLILLGRYDEFKFFRIKMVITMNMIDKKTETIYQQYNHIYEYYGANDEYIEGFHKKEFSAYEITKTCIADAITIMYNPEKYDSITEYSKVKIIKGTSGNLYYQYQLEDSDKWFGRKFTHKFKCESFIE